MYSSYNAKYACLHRHEARRVLRVSFVEPPHVKLIHTRNIFMGDSKYENKRESPEIRFQRNRIY